MLKNNLGWIVAATILLCQPALSAAPTLCLWDMYAMAAIASGKMAFPDATSSGQCDWACTVANEMIKRRSGK